MIKIKIHRLFDETACAVSAVTDENGLGLPKPPVVHELSYVRCPMLAHSETDMLRELIERGLDEAEERVSALGGWSALV